LTGYPNPIYYCPSDRPGGIWKGDSYAGRCRGNYAVDWGYCDFTQTQPTGFMVGTFTANHQMRGEEITKGLSRCMMMAEVLEAPDETFDVRGDIFNDGPGSAEFMSFYTPNSGIDSCTCSEPDPVIPAPCVPGGPVYMSSRSKHPGGVNVSFMDGSGHFIPDVIETNYWQSLSAKDLGVTVPTDDF